MNWERCSSSQSGCVFCAFLHAVKYRHSACSLLEKYLLSAFCEVLVNAEEKQVIYQKILIPICGT